MITTEPTSRRRRRRPRGRSNAHDVLVSEIHEAEAVAAVIGPQADDLKAAAHDAVATLGRYALERDRVKRAMTAIGMDWAYLAERA